MSRSLPSTSRVWMPFAMFAVLAACSSEAAPPAPPITYQAAPTPAREEVEEEPTVSNVPVTEDFQDEAEAEINAETFRSELDRLEADIKNDQQ